jgi:hypothetical protein
LPVDSGSAARASRGPADGRASQSHSAKTLPSLHLDEEAMLRKILSEPMDYIDHPEYHLPDAAERIYGAAEITRPDVTWYRPLMDDFISTRRRSAKGSSKGSQGAMAPRGPSRKARPT